MSCGLDDRPIEIGSCEAASFKRGADDAGRFGQGYRVIDGAQRGVPHVRLACLGSYA
jgi:hypothetical protein